MQQAKVIPSPRVLMITKSRFLIKLRKVTLKKFLNIGIELNGYLPFKDTKYFKRLPEWYIVLQSTFLYVWKSPKVRKKPT